MKNTDNHYHMELTENAATQLSLFLNRKLEELRRTPGNRFMKFNNFQEFMESLVIPLSAENPNWRRLDGRSTGGNRLVFGMFDHDGKT
jgi:hypothetical protein